MVRLPSQHLGGRRWQRSRRRQQDRGVGRAGQRREREGVRRVVAARQRHGGRVREALPQLQVGDLCRGGVAVGPGEPHRRRQAARRGQLVEDRLGDDGRPAQHVELVGPAAQVLQRRARQGRDAVALDQQDGPPGRARQGAGRQGVRGRAPARQQQPLVARAPREGAVVVERGLQQDRRGAEAVVSAEAQHVGLTTGRGDGVLDHVVGDRAGPAHDDDLLGLQLRQRLRRRGGQPTRLGQQHGQAEHRGAQRVEGHVAASEDDPGRHLRLEAEVGEEFGVASVAVLRREREQGRGLVAVGTGQPGRPHILAGLRRGADADEHTRQRRSRGEQGRSSSGHARNLASAWCRTVAQERRRSWARKHYRHASACACSSRRSGRPSPASRLVTCSAYPSASAVDARFVVQARRTWEPVATLP